MPAVENFYQEQLEHKARKARKAKLVLPVLFLALQALLVRKVRWDLLVLRAFRGNREHRARAVVM
jgi:hypothetical protein